MNQCLQNTLFSTDLPQTLQSQPPYPFDPTQLIPISNTKVWLNNNKVCRLISTYSHYLIIHSKKGNFKWMNIENARMNKHYDSQMELAATFTKGGLSITIYGDVDVVVAPIIKYLFQGNFHQHYALLGLIGKGTFADVYVGQNRRNGINHAVKCFKKQSMSNQDKYSIIKEISIYRELQDTHISNLVEVFESDEYVYLITEYMQGGTLERMIKKQQLSEQQTLKIIRKVLEAINYLHSQGIIHRDIKPENIIFRNKISLEDVCIADFGLADFYNLEGKYMFPRCGTPGYVAPELLQDKQYDYKIDVYSVGILMYLLISGKHPFQGDDYPTIVKKNLSGNIDYSILQLTPQGMSLLKGLLEYNPIQRLNAATALKHRWFNPLNLDMNIVRSSKLSPTKMQTIKTSLTLSTTRCKRGVVDGYRSPLSGKLPSLKRESIK